MFNISDHLTIHYRVLRTLSLSLSSHLAESLERKIAGVQSIVQSRRGHHVTFFSPSSSKNPALVGRRRAKRQTREKKKAVTQREREAHGDFIPTKTARTHYPRPLFRPDSPAARGIIYPRDDKSRVPRRAHSAGAISGHPCEGFLRGPRCTRRGK